MANKPSGKKRSLSPVFDQKAKKYCSGAIQSPKAVSVKQFAKNDVYWPNSAGKTTPLSNSSSTITSKFCKPSSPLLVYTPSNGEIDFAEVLTQPRTTTTVTTTTARMPTTTTTTTTLKNICKYYKIENAEQAFSILNKTACIELCDEISSNNKSLVTTLDDKIIAQRLVEIVHAHRSGIMEDSIPYYYKKNYNESLPSNWVQILVSLDNMIEIHDCVANFLIKKKIVPKPIILPTADSLWLVQITKVKNTNEVWGRLNMAPYSELLVALEKDMRDHYSCVLEPAKNILPFRYYAVKSCSTWHRVQVKNVVTYNGIKKAYVFFIDIGDTKWMNCKLLYPMVQQFYKIAAQAIKMSISRLENFAGCQKVTDIANQILDRKSLYIQVIGQEVDTSNVHIITSVLWDINIKKAINLNEEIIQHIELFSFESPYVEKKNLKVLLTSVDDDGNIFLKSMNDALDIYQIILDKVTKVELTDDLKEKVKLENLNIDRTKIFEEIFLVDYNNDNKWIRVKIIKILDLDLFKVFAIDKGFSFIIKKSKLLLLKFISEFLNSFPQQITQVTLYGVEKLNLKMIKRLEELTPKDKTLSCDVIKSGKVPCVELIKRTTDNLLVSINLNLKEYQTNNNTKINDNQIKSKNGRGSLQNKIKLRPPIVAARGKVFSAYVTNNCANPDNFIVQPRQNINSLKEMIKKLSVTCDNYDGPQLETVQAGQLYAAQSSDDGRWCRVYVKNILDDQTIAVYFCDYGIMSITSIDKLQPLDSSLFDLPYQAIRAKLVGIKPKNGVWDLHDCSAFHDLVVDKNFEATIEDIETDIIRNNDILGLKLTDKTSLSRSRDIKQVLIDKNIAVSTI